MMAHLDVVLLILFIDDVNGLHYIAEHKVHMAIVGLRTNQRGTTGWWTGVSGVP